MAKNQPENEYTKTWKNPRCSDEKRVRYFDKRVLAEIADAKDIWRTFNSRTMDEKLRDYINTKTMEDHISFYMVVCVLYGRKQLPLPQAWKDLWTFKKERDKVSTQIGKVMDKSDGVCIGRALHKDPETGDIEFVMFNAKKQAQIKKQLAQRERFSTTIVHRTVKRIENVIKSPAERKKIMRQEQLANAGTI